MYESFYGLKEKPFTLLPDPEYLYLSPKHQRALTLLEYGMMNQAGFSVICGDTGAGKTTLIRRLLTELSEDTTVGLITNTHQSFGELLNWVLMAFGLDGDGKSKAQMHQMFISFLIEQYASKKHVVLIVDEAQNMSADTLEELRMLSNINADKDQVLQVILAGQPALRETLRKPELMQFAQRIAVDYYLEALSMEETAAYIKHRLGIAGADREIFTPEACEAIYRYSGGTPRLINLLCDTALVYGFAEQSEVISDQLVDDVVEEQHSNSVIPTFHTDRPHKSNEIPLHQPDQEVIEEKAEEADDRQKEHLQQAESAIEHLVERAVKAVSIAEQSVASAQARINNSTQAVRAEEARLQAVGTEKPDEAIHNARVTPISSRQPVSDDKEYGKRQEREPESASVAENKIAYSEDKAESVNNEAQDNREEVNEGSSEMDRGVTDDGAASSERQEEQYPIVHIEENPKKSMGLVIVGLIGGMLVSSIAMVIVTWLLLSSDEAVVTSPGETEKGSLSENERREMEILQKERDAALAISRALEHERDAAIAAAKAQEEMRAAERKAAEILAQQEREAEARLREARARARAAERAEQKALERERLLRQKTEAKAAELEARKQEEQRLTRIQEEKTLARIQYEKQQAEEHEVVQNANTNDTKEELETVEELKRFDKTAVVTTQNDTASEKTPKKSKSFTANPCNSASAKFLSTCKK